MRGRGLLLGAALADGIDAKAVYAELLDRGLIVNAVNGSTIRLVPPITVTDDEIDEARRADRRRAGRSIEAALATSGGAAGS